MDYQPLDLSAYCHSGSELYENLDFVTGSNLYRPPGPPPRGRQTFHGLPFQIGPETGQQDHYLLGLGAGLQEKPFTIPLQRTATYLIFAHALLETRLWQGGPMGETVVRYTACYEDGSRVEIPIRERFEVGNIPVPWGQFPFLALPDMADQLMPRYHGEWAQIGARLTEASNGTPQAYYVWAWCNPHPERQLTALEVVPTRYRYVLAAITSSQLDEEPFSRQARRPVKITLTRPEDAARPLALSVAVDRGLATYPYPLPTAPLDEIEPEMAGFGAPENKGSSPAYTEIAASPSATIDLKLGDENVGQLNWGELERAGAVQLERARIEVVDPGRNWVKVRVEDAGSGQPIPCRVAFHSPEGVPFPPHGHHAPVFSNFYDWNIDVGGDARLGHISYAYIDGTCQGWLPRGRVLVDIARGFEYEPRREWVEIEPGQQQLTLRLERWIDMKEQRYFSGDSHVHFLSPQGGHTEAAGEDLNVVNLLQSQWGHNFSNTEDFSGRPTISQNGETIVYVSQENRQHILGHLSLLGLKEPVMPWASGGPSEAELAGSLETTLSRWADACRAQGGTVVVPHVPAPNGEPAALIATGRADALEFLEHLPYEHLEYYRYLNGGYQMPLAGGTDKMSSNTPVGLYRTYVHIPADEPFTYDNWCRHLRLGHTFLSGGPLIWFTVEGQLIGSQLRVSKGGTVEVEAAVRSIFPIHSLQIVQGGKVVAETTEAAGAKHLTLRERIKIEGDSWLAARCAGPGYRARPHHDRRQRGIMAHTSPIYIRCQETYELCDPATLFYMLTLIDGSVSFIRQRSRQYPPETTTHQHHHADHLAYLEEPFQEARQAIHQRLHALGIPH
jgi:hypothetical protein